jgi:hypothetical protein
MSLSRRGFFAAGAAAVVTVPALAIAVDPPATKTASSAAPTVTPAATVAPGQLTEESLGNLLKSMGLKPEKVEKRYDFVFRSVYNKEDWDLSMTSVLSADGKSIWIMAWLDELPKSALDTPRTALLRLLAANDRLGNGKFFAYVASNRRFVLQRIIPNEGLSTKLFRDALADLGTSVCESYPYWSVSNWSAEKPATTNTAAKPEETVPASQTGLQGAGKAPTKTATNEKPTTVK